MASKAFSVGILCISILLFMNIFKKKKCHSAFIHKSFKELTKVQYSKKQSMTKFGLVCHNLWKIEKTKNRYELRNYKSSKNSLLTLEEVLKK